MCRENVWESEGRVENINSHKWVGMPTALKVNDASKRIDVRRPSFPVLEMMMMMLLVLLASRLEERKREDSGTRTPGSRHFVLENNRKRGPTP